MGMRKTPRLAPRLWALAALNAINPMWALPDAAIARAGPLWQEETVYRPECPSDEISSGWAACRLATRGNRPVGDPVKPGNGASNGRHD